MNVHVRRVLTTMAVRNRILESCIDTIRTEVSPRIVLIGGIVILL